MFPEEMKHVDLTAEARLYSPADQKRDITKTFTVQNGEIHFAVPASVHGFKKIQMSWTAAGKEYYDERKIILP